MPPVRAGLDPRFASVVRLGAKRTLARAGLVGAIAVTVAMSVALLCGVTAWMAVDSRAAIAAAVPNASRPGGWVAVQTRPAADAEAQDAAAAALFDGLFGDTADVVRTDVGESGTDTARVAWRISPRRAELDGAAVLRLEPGVAALPEAFRDSDAAVAGSESSGTLGATLDPVAQGVRASAAISPVPIAIAGILVWFAVLELGRLLGAARGREAGLLRARGVSRAQSGMLSLTESTIVVVVATAVGFAGALAVLAARPAGVQSMVDTWPLAAAMAIVLAVTLGLAQSRSAFAASSARSSAGRVARAASTGAAVLVVLGAAVLVWQSAGSGGGRDEPLSVVIRSLAPAFGVAAVGILAVLLFAPLSAAVAVLAERSPALAPTYPARQVGRRVVAFSVAVALVAIAMCAAVLAASYIATWHNASANSARLVAGAPLRADLGARSVVPADVRSAAAVEGVTRAAPAISTPIVAGDLAATLVALPHGAIDPVLISVGGAASSADLAAVLAHDPIGLALADGATGLRLTGLSTAQAWRSDQLIITSPDPDADSDLTAQAWVTDASGTVVTVDMAVSVAAGGLASAGDGRPFAAEGRLPDGVSPWRVIGVELSRGRGARFQMQQLRISQLQLAGVASGSAEPLDAPMAGVDLTGWGLGLPATATVWSAGGAAASVVPAVVTTSFADPLGLGRGDKIGIRVDGTGRDFTIEVADVVDAIPGLGARPGVLAALDQISAAPLITRVSTETSVAPPLANQVWAAGSASASGALAQLLGVPVATPVDAAAAVTGGLVNAWWVGAIGGVLLAAVALIALVTALTGQRGGEVLVLRAAGVPPARQARMRALEASVVVVLAVVLGAVGGLVLSFLVVPGLADAAVPGSALPATLAVDPWLILVALGVLGAAVVAIAVGGAAAVRRQGSSTRLEEAAP